MGSSKDIMHLVIAREIAGNFSRIDGWTSTQLRIGKGYNQVFSIDRYVMGTKESVILGVSFDRAVTQDFIDFISTAVTGGTAFPQMRQRFDIMVPKNADISVVPPSWKIHLMNEFGFDGESLIWIKKPVRKTTEEPVKKPAVT
jgi:hypothetical protein